MVFPEFEEIITSPINASVVKVSLDAGNEVKAGESNLKLDKAATRTEYENQTFNWSLSGITSKSSGWSLIKVFLTLDQTMISNNYGLIVYRLRLKMPKGY